MATPRQTVAAQIQADNPKWKVLDYPFTPSNVQLGSPVVSVWRSGVDPGASTLHLSHGVQIFVYGARTASTKAEDEMDELLDGVLLSIERLGGWRFTSAKRGLFFEDTLAGWLIEATAESTNVYKQQILRERS